MLAANAVTGLLFHANVTGLPVLLGIMLMAIPHAFALGPLPWLMMSELYPTRLRARAVAFTTALLWIILPGDRVLVTSGYGTGSELLQIKQDTEGKWSASRIWKSIRLKAKFTNVVYHEGFIYGLDDGILVCLDAADGSLKWKEGRYGHGQVILTGSLLLVSAESGDMVLVEPVPQEHRELTRFTALRGKTWNPPALAGDLLVVRNDKEAACYRLPVAKP